MTSLSIVIKVTGRHTECIYFNKNYSQLKTYNFDPVKKQHLSGCSWTAASLVEQHRFSIFFPLSTYVMSIYLIIMATLEVWEKHMVD